MTSHLFIRDLARIVFAIAFLIVLTGCLETVPSPMLEQALSAPEPPSADGRAQDTEPVPPDAIPIASINQLQQIGDHPDYPLDGHYVLTQDIDASATADWNEGKGFEPIGARGWGELEDGGFTGRFNGRGHVIRALTINRPEEDAVGLFGGPGNNSVIQNVGLEDCHIEGNNMTGSLAGLSSAAVSMCYATGVVQGGSSVGGLIGSNNTEVSDSYASCTVSGADTVGGLVGMNSNLVSRCFSTGAGADGDFNTHGLVGDSPASGGEAGIVEDSFWDVETSGQDATHSGATGLTTAEMQTRSTFTEAGWDFDEVWGIDEGEDYPYLRWELDLE